jgi:hypothetical protein
LTVAQLGFAIDSSQAAEAASDLDRLTSSAAKAEQAAQRTGAAGTRMSRGFADLNPALEKIVGSLGRLEGITTSIDKRLDAMASATTRAARANTVLDRSAIEASTAYKQLEASLNAVTAAQRKGDTSLATSLSAIEKQREAIARLNAELQKLRSAPSPAVPGGRPSPANNNGNQGTVGNIAAQFFDIGTTAAFMNPATVAIQQGPQLAQAFAGQSTKQAMTSLAAGLGALVSPMSLAAIGLTGIAAAAIQYGVSLVTASDDTKKLEEAMERHDGVMKRLEDRYGSLISKAKGYGAESARVLQFEASSDIRGLRNATKAAGKELFDQGTISFFDTMTDPTSLVAMGAFQNAILKLQIQAKEGKPDFDAFYDSLYKTAAIDPKYATKADELAKLVEQYRQGTKAIEEMERAQRALFNDRGSNGMLLSQGPSNQADMGNLALYESQQRVAAQRQRQGFDAQILGVNARSPQERAAAARASASAQYNNDETGTQRRVRIEQAGALALAQAERQLADAQRDRAANLDKILADQQSEIDLIGKTGGAAVALRKEYELTSQLRLDAARQGIDVDQKELDLIKERAAALGQLTDQYNQSRFNFDMGQQAGDARLSPRDRQITSALRQYGLPEDVGGANAGRIGSQMDWQERKDVFKGLFTGIEQEAWANGGDIGKAVMTSIKNGLQKASEKAFDTIFDRLATSAADWLTGASGSSGSVAAAALGRTAANNNTAGGFTGLAAVGSVTRASIPDVGSSDIASYISKAAAARGIDPNIALAVAKSEGGLNSWNLQSNYVKNGVREPSFGPFQLYKGGGLGNEFMRKTGMDPANAASGPAGVDFALDHASKNGWGAWYGAKKAGISNFEGIGVGGAGSAAEAVDKLASSAGAATKGLDTMAGGLGKAGQALSTSFFPSAPSAPTGGGGLGGLFSSLFGGGLSSAQIAKYTPLTGLFADGTNYAPGGMAIVGERGPELVNLPQGSQVFSNQKSRDMMRGGGSEGGGARNLTVHVVGATGNQEVQSMVRQGVQSALAEDRVEMRRSGFGSMQAAYTSDRG